MKVIVLCFLVVASASQGSPLPPCRRRVEQTETAKQANAEPHHHVHPERTDDVKGEITRALNPSIAAVKLAGADPTVTGILQLTQNIPGVSPVRITGTVSGLTPGRHGFHVHQLGDIATNLCLSTGSHYNPLKLNHGAPQDLIRHAGDLGNIEADANGVATIDITDNKISLSGVNSIVGRSFVVHAGADDLGRVGNAGSLTTGNAGGRVACGVVGLV